MATKEPQTLQLTPELRERLTDLSTRYRVSRSLIVRETLDACLGRWEHEYLSGIPFECQSHDWLGRDGGLDDD